MGSLERAMKWAALEKQSIMVRIVLLPAEMGRPVTKSKEMWDQGRDGVGKGRWRPDDGPNDAGGWQHWFRVRVGLGGSELTR